MCTLGAAGNGSSVLVPCTEEQDEVPGSWPGPDSAWLFLSFPLIPSPPSLSNKTVHILYILPTMRYKACPGYLG